MTRVAILVVITAVPAFCDGIVSGILRDFLTGAPIGGASLTLSRATTVNVRTASLAGTGEFRFEAVPAGTYTLTISKPGYASMEVLPQEIVRVTGGNETKLAPTLKPGATIEGRLVSEEGTPIVGAIISTPHHTARTNSQGRFRLADLEAGPRSLDAEMPEELRRATAKGTAAYPASVRDGAMFELAPGETRTGVELRIRREPMVSFSGTVIDSRTGHAPPDGAAIELTPVNIFAGNRSRLPLPPGGAFQFDLLKPGEYQVTVFRSAAFSARPIASQVTVGGDGLAGHRIVLSSASTRIDVHLVNEPPPGLMVSLSPPGFGIGMVQGKKIDDKRIVFEDLAPGRWRISTAQSRVGLSDAESQLPWPRVEISQAGRVFSGTQHEFDVVDGENAPLELTFRERFAVTGNVIDAADRPVPDAILFHQAGGTKSIFMGGRNDGTFRIDVEPGEYLLSAWPRDRMKETGACANTQPVRVSGNVTGLRMMICP